MLQSCNNTSPSEPTDEIEGEYMFKYPSGQIEILSIKNRPRTYEQFFYASEKDLVNKNAPLYENKNTWVVFGSELEFHDWLSICYLGRFTDSILTKPERGQMGNVHWYKTTKNKKARIDMAYEEGYILRKSK